MKRFFALVLVFAMVLSLVPWVFATGEEEIIVYTEEDYVTADLLWEKVNAKEDEMQSKKATVKQTTEAIVAEITSSPYYAEDTLIRNGEYIFWETVDGIPCGYSPRLSRIGNEATPLEGYDLASEPTVLTYSATKRGGYPNARDVYLIQPYYGLDASFTTQYEEEAERIAQATGGTATIYRTTAATIDVVAEAMESGAVVIFDSHGDTDYTKGEDSVSQANSSYLCLQVGTGLNSKDYEPETGAFGTYYHAFYGGSYKELKYYCVDGTAIANHMDKKGQNSILWMAICLSMATDGLQAPLRSNGVEVVYGYSQSVTFTYDYMWEEAFWDKMIMGETVSRAIAYMKDNVGDWDYCHSAAYDTITEAREKYCAFPIVVSSEDAYPGQGNVDALQAVTSTYTLIAPCSHPTYKTVPYTAPTCTQEGNILYYTCTECSALFSDSARQNQIFTEDTVIPATGHSYDAGTVHVPATCKSDGSTLYTCITCGYIYTATVPALGHNYVSGLCTHCGGEEPFAEEFEPGISGKFVIAAKVNGKYYAFPNSYTTTSTKYSPIEIEIPYGYVELEDSENIALELIYDSDREQYLIYNGTYNLKYPSATNLSGTESNYYWSVVSGKNGTWRFISETTNRGLVYRAGSFLTWGCYHLPNVVAGGKEYFDLELIPVASTTQKPCEHIMDEGVVTTPATCIAEGVMTYTCTLCGKYTATEAIPLTDHSWDSGTVTTAPGCDTEGILTYSCSGCTETTTESIPATGEHAYENGVCTGCGIALPTEPGEPILDNNIKIGHNLNLASDISINYAVRESDLQDYDSFYLTCVVPKYEGNELVSSRTVNIDPVYKDGLYYFTLTGITAVHMGNEIQSILYMTKGEDTYYSPTDVYSVATYAYAQLNKASVTDALKKICADLLVYGAKAQIFKEYRTDALVDANMTEEMKDYLTDLEEVSFNENKGNLNDAENIGVSWLGTGIDLNSKVTIRFIFALTDSSVNPEDLSATITYENYRGKVVTKTVDTVDVYNASKGYYCFTFDGLLAAELRSVMKAVIFNNETRVSGTFIYSIDTYGNGKTGDLLALCKSLIAYSDTALAYFTNN